MKINIELDDMQLSNLQAILKLTSPQMSLEEHVRSLCLTAVNNEISFYADNRDKRVHVKSCFLMPSKYEMKVFENEYKLSHNCVPSADAIYEYTETHTRDVFYLGDELPVYGEKYCKLYDPSKSTIIKAPVNCVNFKEIKE